MSHSGHNNKPSFDADDPRVSAYALGEMNEQERAQFEAAVAAAGPQARAALDGAVAEVLEAASLFTAALATEPSPALDRPLNADTEAEVPAVIPFQSIQINLSVPLKPAAGPVSTSQMKDSKMKIHMGKAALAACLMVGLVGVGGYMVMGGKGPGELTSLISPARAPAAKRSAADAKSADGRGFRDFSRDSSTEETWEGEEYTIRVNEPVETSDMALERAGERSYEGQRRAPAAKPGALRNDPTKPAAQSSATARDSEQGLAPREQDAKSKAEFKNVEDGLGPNFGPGAAGGAAGKGEGDHQPTGPYVRPVPRPVAPEYARPVAPPVTTSPVPLPQVPPPADKTQQAGDVVVNGEGYTSQAENDFFRVTQEPLSTFSIDVDTASYSNMRRFILDQHRLPPAVSVRIEEYLNYFTYDYAPPKDDAPFAAHMEVAGCPWNSDHRLVRVALKGREIAKEQRPLSNLVFLLDVSGSMNTAAKLPMVKDSMKMLVDQLGENDRVAIVVYAGASGLVLPSTMCDQKSDIYAALDKLFAGGSTAGGAGIELAYDVAVSNFIKGGTNRVILCTDGDFNVGVRNPAELQTLIERKAKTGVFLSVFGFGMGNLKDNNMETLANKGNGNYGYIDSLEESKKVFMEQMSGTLVTIAKDVKIQIEFNPGRVVGYRLLGYENRVLAAQDFNNDKKDAGEIGAGHTVTALYEIVPADKNLDIPGVDKLKYQKRPARTEAAESEDLLTLKLRFKQPDAEQSVLREFTLSDAGKSFGQATEDFKFATAVASYAMLLKDSKYAGNSTFGSILEIAESTKGTDKSGYRAEFVELVKKAKALRGN